MAELKENVIEWFNGDDTISVTLNQKKYISKVKKLAEKYPDLVQILDENKDGSIFCSPSTEKSEIVHNHIR